jgi:hypothetical protein
MSKATNTESACSSATDTSSTNDTTSVWLKLLILWFLSTFHALTLPSPLLSCCTLLHSLVLCHTPLCSAVLPCALLCSLTLCCTLSHSAVLSHALPHSLMLCCTLLCSAALSYALLHSLVLCCTLLHSAALCCALPHSATCLWATFPHFTLCPPGLPYTPCTTFLLSYHLYPCSWTFSTLSI